MTQAQTTPKSSAPLGVQAAAAATTGGGAKPAEAKPDAKPAKPPRKKAAEMTEAEKAAAKTERLAKAKKVFIVVGTVHEFDSVNKAEKFLNGDGETPAPTEYAVLRGNRIGTSKKVSLR
jgi:hypothetical protein